MDSSPLRNVQPLQAALANAFCYLISSMDDSNVYVAQRATLYLGTIHDAAVKVSNEKRKEKKLCCGDHVPLHSIFILYSMAQYCKWVNVWYT